MPQAPLPEILLKRLPRKSRVCGAYMAYSIWIDMERMKF